MNPTTRKLVVWAGVLVLVSHLFLTFQVIRLFTPGLAEFVQRAKWTMLPAPTRLLLDHPNLASAIPLFLIGALCAAVGLVQLRVRDEPNQLASALLIQVSFWWLFVTYAGAVCMAGVLPFLHVANR